MTLYAAVESPPVRRVSDAKDNDVASQYLETNTWPLPAESILVYPVSDSSPNAPVYKVRSSTGRFTPPELAILDSRTNIQQIITLQQQRDFESLWKQIARWYVVDNVEGVQLFIRQHPLVAKTLIDAIEQLPKYFGATIHVALELVIDTEEDDEQLFAYIHAALPVEDALNRLERLDEEWFLSWISQLNGSFNFNLRFV